MGNFLGTYDPSKVTITLGTYTVTGFADGTFIKAAMTDAEIYKLHVGAHGESARTKNLNKTGKITLTLKQTSPSNKILDAMKASGIPVPVMMKDSSDSTFVAAAANAWVSKDPDTERAAEESKIEWEITCDELLKSNL